MERGILTLSKNDINFLQKNINLEIFNQTQLSNKLNEAFKSKEEEVKIFLSEDEVEKIMDELGIPSEYPQLFEKLSTFLIHIRSSKLPDLDSN